MKKVVMIGLLAITTLTMAGSGRSAMDDGEALVDLFYNSIDDIMSSSGVETKSGGCGSEESLNTMCDSESKRNGGFQNQCAQGTIKRFRSYSSCSCASGGPTIMMKCN